MRYNVTVPKEDYQSHFATLDREFPGAVVLELSSPNRGRVFMNIEADVDTVRTQITSLIAGATVREDGQGNIE